MYCFQLRPASILHVKNVFHFQNFWIRFIFNIVITGDFVKSTVGIIKLADGQNLFEMLICLRGLPMFWLEENLCTILKKTTNKSKHSKTILELPCNILHINKKWRNFPLAAWNKLRMACSNFTLKKKNYHFTFYCSSAAVPDEKIYLAPQLPVFCI